MSFIEPLLTDISLPSKRLSLIVKQQTGSTQDGLTAWAYYTGLGPLISSRGDSGDATKEWYPYLVSYKPSRASNNPLTGKLTQSDITFEVLTTNDHALKWMVGTEDPSGSGASALNIYQDISVWLGPEGNAPHGAYARLFVGKIINIKLHKDGDRWIVRATSALTKARGTAMGNASNIDLLEGGDMDSWGESPTQPQGWTKTQSGTTVVKETDRPTGQRAPTSGGSSARFTFDSSGSLGQLEEAVTIAVENVYTLELYVKGTVAGLPFEVAFENTDTSNWLSVAEVTPGAAAVVSTWSASETWLPCVPGDGEFVRKLFRFKTEATGTNLTVYIRGTGSGLSNETVNVDDVSLSKKIIANGNPVDLAAAILTDPAVGGFYTFAPGGITWLAGEPTGAGLTASISPSTASDVFVATFEDERDGYLLVDRVDVTFNEPVQAISYLEQQFLRLWGYLYVGVESMLCFRAHHAPEIGASQVVIDETNILKYRGWQRRFDLLINSVRIWGDYNPEESDIDGEKWTQLALVQDTDGIAADGLRELEIKSKWLQTQNGGVLVALNAASRLFGKYNRAQEEIKLDGLVSLVNTTNADTISLTSPQVPNIMTRSMGVTDLVVEPVSIAHDVLKGKISITMMRSFYANAGFIAPNSTPTWLSATTAHKLYAFISDPADDLMSDDEPGYQVT